jgi:hypothetical protein
MQVSGNIALMLPIPNTDHGNIAEALQGEKGDDATGRCEDVRHALRGEIAEFDRDLKQALNEDSNIKRIIYVMHGIRDYGGWTDKLRSAIEEHRLIPVTRVGGRPRGTLLLCFWPANARWHRSRAFAASFVNVSVSGIGMTGLRLCKAPRALGISGVAPYFGVDQA